MSTFKINSNNSSIFNEVGAQVPFTYAPTPSLFKIRSTGEILTFALLMGYDQVEMTSMALADPLMTPIYRESMNDA